jgi:hypothetical protein
MWFVYKIKAAKCGLAKMCWLITREKKGEAAKLVMVKDNSDQTPYEFIRNERSPKYDINSILIYEK